MGTHHRAGADSPVQKLDLHSLRLIFAVLELKTPLSSAPAVLRESLCAEKWHKGMMPVVYSVDRAWKIGSAGTAVGKQKLTHGMMYSMQNLRQHVDYKFEKDDNIKCDLTWLERILDLGNVDNLELCYSKATYSMHDLVFEGISQAAEAFVAGTAPEYVRGVGVGEFQQAVIVHLQQPAARSRRVRAPRIKRYLDWFGDTVSMSAALLLHHIVVVYQSPHKCTSTFSPCAAQRMHSPIHLCLNPFPLADLLHPHYSHYKVQSVAAQPAPTK